MRTERTPRKGAHGRQFRRFVFFGHMEGGTCPHFSYVPISLTVMPNATGAQGRVNREGRRVFFVLKVLGFGIGANVLPVLSGGAGWPFFREPGDGRVRAVPVPNDVPKE